MSPENKHRSKFKNINEMLDIVGISFTQGSKAIIVFIIALVFQKRTKEWFFYVLFSCISMLSSPFCIRCGIFSQDECLLGFIITPLICLGIAKRIRQFIAAFHFGCVIRFPACLIDMNLPEVFPGIIFGKTFGGRATFSSRGWKGTTILEADWMDLSLIAFLSAKL